MKTYNSGFYMFFKTSDMVTVQIATISEREEMLERVVNSLINQVDQINIMLNGHKEAPYFLKQLEFHTTKINYFKLDNSTGDAAKFYGVEKLEGYVFTCDDDLIYPKDYVKVMIAKLKEYDNKVILTNHGREMNPKPVSSIYSDRVVSHHCLENVEYDYNVDIGGTGVMLFATDYFKPKYSEFKRKNMADIWIAKQAKEQGCKIMVNAHKEGWLVYADFGMKYKTIWDEKYGNDKIETEIYNSF